VRALHIVAIKVLHLLNLLKFMLIIHSVIL
jgi:hypothetical protein